MKVLVLLALLALAPAAAAGPLVQTSRRAVRSGAKRKKPVRRPVAPAPKPAPALEPAAASESGPAPSLPSPVLIDPVPLVPKREPRPEPELVEEPAPQSEPLPSQPSTLPLQPEPVPVKPAPVPVKPAPVPVKPAPVPVKPAPVPAQQPPAPVPATPPEVSPPDPGLFLFAPKVGFFQPAAPLGRTLSVAAEVGVRLPVLEKRLAVVTEVGYHQPSLQGRLEDGQLLGPGGPVDGSWGLTLHQLSLRLSLLYRLEGGALIPYVGAGPSLSLHQAHLESFGSTYVESTLGVGVQAVAGMELRLGPGGLFAEAHYHWIRASLLATGSEQAGGFLLGSAGYRFHF